VSITSTLIIQMIVFLILVWFTMKFIWPPLPAKAELSTANQRVEQQLAAARDDAAKRLADAERLAHQMVEEAKTRASEEGAKIIAQAKAEADQEAVKAREALRGQVAGLAVKGAEAILRREVDARVHAELLTRLKTEL
jgi:F-type H+-transporting ATPase subunit b